MSPNWRRVAAFYGATFALTHMLSLGYVLTGGSCRRHPGPNLGAQLLWACRFAMALLDDRTPPRRRANKWREVRNRTRRAKPSSLSSFAVPGGLDEQDSGSPTPRVKACRRWSRTRGLGMRPRNASTETDCAASKRPAPPPNARVTNPGALVCRALLARQEVAPTEGSQGSTAAKEGPFATLTSLPGFVAPAPSAGRSSRSGASARAPP
jgi:hypothetical protein